MFEYVGEEAYTAAGGTLTADLFSDKDSTFADAALVKSLLAGKLTVLAARVKQEQGWGWAEFRMTELRPAVRTVNSTVLPCRKLS
jgi:ParB family chromosome partitioning protein